METKSDRQTSNKVSFITLYLIGRGFYVTKFRSQAEEWAEKIAVSLRWR
ncbi:MAG: DUF3990 domain-containing protein [Tannerellaceae bacterium]|jgi:hypothetical protein|nr:DUF3990 domain-containing protein [Tannerellaceae bacterium]